MKFDTNTIVIITIVIATIIYLYSTKKYNSPIDSCDCVGVTAAAQGLLDMAVLDMTTWWYTTLENEGFSGGGKIKKEPITIALLSYKTMVNPTWGKTSEEAKIIIKQMANWGANFIKASNMTTTPAYILLKRNPNTFEMLSHFINTIYILIQNVSGPNPLHGMCI